jgi:signal transduction histidine kinase/PleD family two-component response regulator
MSEVTPTVSAQHGAFFLSEPGEDGTTELVLTASYGYTPRRSELRSRFQLGEGLVGQAAFERKAIALTDLPPGYIQVGSGLGEASAAGLLILPVLFEDQLLGVLEFAAIRPFTEVNRDFLARLTETIGVVINTIRANMRTEELLAQSQGLTQELQKQSEELRSTNDELQQKARLLSEQNRDIEIKNDEIERARLGLEEKAAQLALSSRYKSEFLANMSHELRTPLNSMLILSRLLAENESGSLTEREVEFAHTIHSAGNDLLSLINDILDLSKVEAGRMELDIGPIALSDIAESAERAFRQVAEESKLRFTVEIDPSLPPSMTSDEQRLNQVLKNLLSNAFKFTHEGEVVLSIGYAGESQEFTNDALRMTEGRVVAFTVSDTGVGIQEEKLAAIFEAFQQADGTTSRKYGGTGLGLSISREIARLLGGEIQVSSKLGQGSRFTFFLPIGERALESAPLDEQPLALNGSGYDTGDAGSVDVNQPAVPAGVPTIADDSASLEPDDRTMLVIDSRQDRAQLILDAVHTRGAKGIVARRPTAALGLAREHRPGVVLLGGDAPTAQLLLSQLKKHPDTRHLPVVVIGEEHARTDALRSGAAAFVEESAGAGGLGDALERLDRKLNGAGRRIAVVDGDAEASQRLARLLEAGDRVEIETLDPDSAPTALADGLFDLTVLPIGSDHEDAIALLRTITSDGVLRELPVIAFVDGELSKPERARLDALAKGAVIAVADSPELLVDRAALFLHRVEATLPAQVRKMLDVLRTGDAPLHGKKVLIVDDDIRNVFALASSLEQRGMKVVFAENGREGIERLHQHANTDVVLLDIMMPEMDGYETARAIRSTTRFEHLPIISLTAKAMKGDREKALAAGASDYITKPVDVDQLVAMMRVWLDA